MSTIVELVMPKLGESIMEATILKWHKKVGDAINLDETLLDIATDKVDSEVPSTAAGIVVEILFKENDIVPIGTTIAKINTGGDAPIATPAPAPEAAPVVAPITEPVLPQVASVTNIIPSSNGNNKFYSPLVLNIAAQEGIGMAELENLNGTGAEGRVTKKDILQYVENKKLGGVNTLGTAVAPAPAISVTPTPTIANTVAPTPAPAVIGGNVEIIEMDRMRKLIAKHMVDSKHTSPHVTSFTEADVTNLVNWRNNVKSKFEQQEGSKLTFTPLFVEALVNCIKRYPLINSSVDGDRIIVKKDFNIGMATALPSGNLIVPVIKNAEQLNLVGLAKQVNGLADAARNGKLKPEDTQNGTFTLTNVGTFGSLMGTPIISQPQVAILAVGAIKKRPVVVETAQGDSIAIRHMMYLSLSYDHRIIDGSLGASFLTAVAQELENFDPARKI
jgi:2-oxoglutarate dehydrogenase E2 component (dihydrolipoamide succinyltransferase)